MKNILNLNDDLIEKITGMIKTPIRQLMGDNVMDIILFGSCARGDYDNESDIDIAIITKTGRQENASYRMGLAEIAADVAMEYFAVVNFLCIPDKEYMERKNWYELYKNIELEGKVI